MPAIHFFGAHFNGAIYPGTVPISQMSPSDLWRTYIRPMGAGGVAASGLITLLRTMPTIIGALRAGVKTIGKNASAGSTSRTERDIPMNIVLLGSGVLVLMIFLFLTFKPIPGAQTGWLANLAAALLVMLFGFLFVTVSSRICGLIGSSSNPVSGMTIATLMAVAAIFLVSGWTAPAFGALAITIGGIVCIASSNAGDTSQDLKTGFLIGATPWKQQVAVMVGVVVSVFSIGLTLNAMNKGLEEFTPMKQPIAFSVNAPTDGVQVQQQHFSRQRFLLTKPDKSTEFVEGSPYMLLNALGSTTLPDGKYLYNPQTGNIEIQWMQGIGSEKAAAPQGRLMATVINGILSRKLPWGLVFLGVFMVIAVEVLGIRSLSFAVGAYLSIGTTLAMFCGGIVRWMVDRAVAKAGGSEEETSSEISPGSLYASGLIAAGGVMGLMGVALKLYEAATGNEVRLWFPAGSAIYNLLQHQVISIIAFGLLAFSLYYFARKPLDNK
jgi:uncharacterized oligopeptide transporter (OPT) family protein